MADLWYAAPLVGGVAAVFFVSYVQARRLVGSSSDHPVHLFLTRTIRENGHRLYTRVPRLLNESYCSAYPLFLHWLLSFFRPSAIYRAAVLENAIVNAVLVGTFYLWASSGLIPDHDVNMSIATLILAFTPQYHHANSARNNGLSSRPIGILLFFAFWAGYGILLTGGETWPWIVLIVTGYLIWGFNTFAQQGLLLFSLLLAVLFRQWIPLVATAISVTVFVLIHPRYGLSYLRHTLDFSRHYALYLAERFILVRRPSVWRDLVWDIWVAIRKNFVRGVAYAYDNSILIVLFLNPLFVWAVFEYARGSTSQLAAVYGPMVLVAAITFLATCLRPFRFLGEPERYVELATPFSTLLALSYIDPGPREMIWLVGYCVLVSGAQMAIAHARLRIVIDRGGEVAELARHVEKHSRETDQRVRFTADNDQIVKYAMAYPWEFVRFWAANCRVAGYRLDEAMDVYPFLRRDSLPRILDTYQINYVVLDKLNPAPVDPRVVSDFTALAETSGLRLFARITARCGRSASVAGSRRS